MSTEEQLSLSMPESKEDVMKQAQEMMNKMSPEELRKIQEMFQNMSEDEKAQFPGPIVY